MNTITIPDPAELLKNIQTELGSDCGISYGADKYAPQGLWQAHHFSPSAVFSQGRGATPSEACIKLRAAIELNDPLAKLRAEAAKLGMQITPIK